MDDARPTRAPFLDLLRVLAAVQMVQGHTVDALLAAPFRSGDVFAAWSWARGLTAVAFLWVAGVAFHASTVRRYERHRCDRGAVARRLRRAGTLVLLGYLLHLPVGLLAEDPLRRAAALDAFVAVDVLQCIGVSLALLEALVLALRSRTAFVVACACAGAAAILLGPAVQTLGVAGPLAPLLHYVTPGGGSLFPLLPWAGHLWLGVALGAWIDVARPSARASRLLVAAAGLLGTAAVAGPFLAQPLVAEHLGRLGWVLAVGALLACVEPVLRVPSWASRVARETLVVYVVHVLLVYGDGVGLGALVGPALAPATAALAAAAVVALSFGLALAWSGGSRRVLARVPATG